MARPIKATPVLKGKDAKRLLESMEKTASPAEIDRRKHAARVFLARVSPNGGASGETPKS